MYDRCLYLEVHSSAWVKSRLSNLKTGQTFPVQVPEETPRCVKLSEVPYSLKHTHLVS